MIRVTHTTPPAASCAWSRVLWRASDKTWRAAVADAWEIKSLAGHPERVLDRGDIPTDRTRASESELPEPVPG